MNATARKVLSDTLGDLAPAAALGALLAVLLVWGLAGFLVR